ncbi:hypothetical protein BJH93_02635 [Kocuria polaris]|nr:hypothetical protein [Kocuria polaris]
MASLATSADLVVTGHVVASEATKEHPTYDSDDPELNPYAGRDDAPTDEEIEAAAIVVTTHTVEVESVLGRRSGIDIEPGAEIRVVEAGGVFNGVTHEVPGIGLLERGDGPLLFLARGEHDYYVVGLDQGKFIADETGNFTSVAEGRTDLTAHPDELGDTQRLLDTSEGR